MSASIQTINYIGKRCTRLYLKVDNISPIYMPMIPFGCQRIVLPMETKIFKTGKTYINTVQLCYMLRLTFN